MKTKIAKFRFFYCDSIFCIELDNKNIFFYLELTLNFDYIQFHALKTYNKRFLCKLCLNNINNIDNR